MYKKLLIVLGVLLVGPKWVMADETAPEPPVVTSTPVPAPTPPVDPNTPPLITTLADGLHIGDNGSVLTLRDVRNGVYGLGSSTTVYKKWYLSADGLIGYLPSVPGANGFYAINGRFWAGQFVYENIPPVKSLADSLGLTARMLQYGTVGYWGARDFQYGLWRHGWDIGVTMKF